LKILTDNVKKAVKPVGGKAWLADSRIYVSDVEDMDDCVSGSRRFSALLGEPGLRARQGL
jgi:hypothetical protein